MTTKLQRRSQGLSSLPPLVVGAETMVAAGHVTSRDQLQPGSLFQRLREAEKRDPGNEVDETDQKCLRGLPTHPT